jgi:hypothetical protein
MYHMVLRPQTMCLVMVGTTIYMMTNKLNNQSASVAPHLSKTIILGKKKNFIIYLIYHNPTLLNVNTTFNLIYISKMKIVQ